MRIASTKNAISGILFGVLNKIIAILIPFALRTIIIYRIGADYAGLNSLFTSVLRVFNIAELGFVSAATYSLYKPIADEDMAKVCALLKFYRKVFRVIGAAVMLIGIALTPFLGYLIKGDYPADINLKVLYYIFLIDSAASYFLYSYKNLILSAYQRVDIQSIIGSVLRIVVFVCQIIVLLVFRNYYLYIVFEVVFTVANNLCAARYISIHYPQYVCTGELEQSEKREIVKNTYGMMLFKICAVTRNSLDTIFISAFIGLSATTVYGNYYYVFTAATNIQTIIRQSMMGGIGNKIALNSPEKNHEDMLLYTYLYAWLSGACTSLMLCLYQTFIKIWVGNSMLLSESSMVLMCVYFYISSIGSIRFLYHQAAGLFWPKRYWTVAEAVCNIVGNYFLVKWLGIFGIILSTIISLVFIDFLYTSKITYDYYFRNNSVRVFFKKHGLYLLFITAGCIPAYLICRALPAEGIPGLLLKMMISLVVSNAVFFATFSRMPEYEQAKAVFKRVIRIILKRFH